MASQSDNDRRDEPERDLAWLAIGYATGDLDAGAAHAFEDRLDADQEAREALAEAVRLLGATALAARAERLSRFRRRTVGLITAMAASVLGLALARPWIGSPPAPMAGDRDAGRITPAPSEAVALAWSGLRRERERDNAGNPPEGNVGTDTLIDALAEPPAEPPAWLVEAAALSPSPAENQDQNGQGS